MSRTRPASLRRSQRPPLTSISALLILLYAAGVYGFFLLVLGYAAGFFAGLGVPKGIDQGTRSPVGGRGGHRRGIAGAVRRAAHRDGPPVVQAPLDPRGAGPAERATFVLCACLTLALLFWWWRPVRGTIWHLSGPGAGVLIALYAAGWAVAVSSTFMISHFDLFGLRQAYLHARGAVCLPLPFTQRGLYRLIRHPLMAGFVLVFWAAPVMTAGHLLLAAAATGYVLAGITFEERDLHRELGAAYSSYRARVPALIPAPRRRSQRNTPGSTRRDDMSSSTVTGLATGLASAACPRPGRPGSACSRPTACLGVTRRPPGPSWRRPARRALTISAAGIM